MTRDLAVYLLVCASYGILWNQFRKARNTNRKDTHG